MTSSPYPPNVHVSQHPCLRAKLSKLRSKSTDGRATKILTHEIAAILGCEAFATALSNVKVGTDDSHLGYKYDTETISPSEISLVPILRSGLGMIDAIATLLPEAVPIHHLGLFRERSSLQPVEYYNNLPYHSTPPDTTSQDHLAIIVDPIIATGGTAVAAIQTLKEWGVSRILVLSVLASEEGIRNAARSWDKVEVWVGGVDSTLDDKGMIKPGVGDIGDRLYGTKGK